MKFKNGQKAHQISKNTTKIALLFSREPQIIYAFLKTKKKSKFS